MNQRHMFLLVTLLAASTALGQSRPQLSPGVAQSVLVATNSIQIDRDTVIASGDVVVNGSTSGPVLGEAALSLDRNVVTPAGYKLAATSIDLDQGVTVGGDVHYNTISSQGTIAGARVTPLALPVFTVLPPVLARSPGSDDVVVPNSGQLTLDEGSYRNLVIGTGATLRLSGGGYSFLSITVGRGGAVRYAAPSDLVASRRAELGAGSSIAPADGSALTASAIRIQVDGINGTDGGLLSTPPAIHIGQTSRVFGTLYATAGSLVVDQNFEGTGAFFARDILVAQGGKLAVNSAFNRPPVADPQTVITTQTSPLTITLTGSDPDGGPLTFSIVSSPAAGTLTTPVIVSPTSAGVTYSPAAADVADSFIFRVRDAAGATGDAVVTINPNPGDPRTPDPSTVLATDSSVQTARDVPATLLLRGAAPASVSLTFSILSNSGPSHGSLGAVTQGTEAPQRTATVVYTADAGFTGSDSFQFQACGVIAGANVCDAAVFSISVQGPLTDPPALAHDVEVSTLADRSVVIALGGNTLETARQRFVVAPHAATLDPVEIAGNVADANADGAGDNANPLPGAVPVFMSAGVGQSGGPGANGIVRMHFEWDLSSVAATIRSLETANVVLPTHRGSVDSLPTFFYWLSRSGDGALTNTDFDGPAEPIRGVVMPVPEEMPAGSDGTFSFSVLDQLRVAVQHGFKFFVVQGRVDEKVPGPARGLEVRTSASGNVSENNVPMLALATPGIGGPLLYRITSLPQSGALRDSAATLLTTVPYTLPDARVSYTPATGFLGLDTFLFEVSDGKASTTARAKITVFMPNCQANLLGCNNGR